MVIEAPTDLLQDQTVKNRFELLVYLQKNHILNKLVLAGIVSITTTTWLDVYKYYLTECVENEKPEAVQFTADYWKLSDRQLYRIISYMENQIS